jgi:cobalt-zinc-cadmium efflux system outer membrane protein
MRGLVLLTLLAACVPSRSSVFGPVGREIERRVGVEATWQVDGRAMPGIRDLLAKPLDRDAVIRIALGTNRRLQAEYDRLGIAASEIASATVLAPLRVDLEYKLARGDQASETEVDVIQDVLDLIQIPQRRAIAGADLDAARARAVGATIDLVARVEGSYIDVVAAQQELELRQTAFDAAAASAEIAQRMSTAGNLPDLALARELDQREQTRIDLGRAQVDVEVAREGLNQVLGLTGELTKWTVSARLPETPEQAPALDDLERDAVAASLDIAAGRADAEAAAGRVGLARFRSVLPELGVGVSLDRKDGEWDAGPAIAIGLPIFNQNQGPRARANAELRRARNEMEATAVELRANARATRQRVLGAYAEATHIRTVILPNRQRVLSEALKQYNAMNASTFELLTARRDLVDAGRQYIDALRRFWRAAAEARALARGAIPRMATDERSPTTSRASVSGGH